jgi:hypothetical protein
MHKNNRDINVVGIFKLFIHRHAIKSPEVKGINRISQTSNLTVQTQTREQSNCSLKTEQENQGKTKRLH